MLCTGSANDHILQDLEVFFQWQNNLLACGNKIANQKKMFFFFSEILTHTTIGFFTRKMMVCSWNLPYLEGNGI